ncbi:helix-turn-helix domain-containing protein [Rhizobium sp. G21]|uniref:helix-turn-helix domain-containing protein n=1 Tax=Rhizobium sp. G21 TaxID=2758439 RepID=UPI0016007C4D|nr:helix-turn-helix domain-containing protein [Rhizobium sp. G21]
MKKLRGKASLRRRQKVVQALLRIASSLDLELDDPVLTDVLISRLPNGTAEQVVFGANDAAKYLGVAPKTLAMWRWKGTGGPPFQKHGSKVVYRRSDLTSFLQATQRTSTSQRPA